MGSFRRAPFPQLKSTMERIEQRTSRRPTLITALFFLSGLWLAVSPYVMDFSWHTTAWWNALVIGIALVVLAAIRFVDRARFEGLRWTALVLGAWLVASPFVTEYVEIAAAMWNAIAIGALVIVASMFAVGMPVRRRV